MTSEELIMNLEKHLEILKNEKSKNWFHKKINTWTIKIIEKRIKQLKEGKI